MGEWESRKELSTPLFPTSSFQILDFQLLNFQLLNFQLLNFQLLNSSTYNPNLSINPAFKLRLTFSLTPFFNSTSYS